MEVMMYGGRYMMAMMGFFAMYCGLIYNDCFALGLNLFGSRWEYPTLSDGEIACYEYAEEHKDCIAIPKYPVGDERNVYPIGADPVWHTSTNEVSILFLFVYEIYLKICFNSYYFSIQ